MDNIFQDLIESRKEAREMGLIIEENFCETCDRMLYNKKDFRKNRCIWCDPKGDK